MPVGFRSFGVVKPHQSDLHLTDYLAANSSTPTLHLTDYLAATSTISLDSPASVLFKAVTAAVEVRVFNAPAPSTRRDFQQSATDKVALPEPRRQQHFSFTLPVEAKINRLVGN